MRREAVMQTKYVMVNTRRCEHCWKCIDKCPSSVFGKINLPFHRHVNVIAAQKCTGCLKCVKTCGHGALIKKEAYKEVSGNI